MPLVRLLVKSMKYEGERYGLDDEFECSALHLKSHPSRLRVVKQKPKPKAKKPKPKVDAPKADADELY